MNTSTSKEIQEKTLSWVNGRIVAPAKQSFRNRTHVNNDFAADPRRSLHAHDHHRSVDLPQQHSQPADDFCSHEPAHIDDVNDDLVESRRETNGWAIELKIRVIVSKCRTLSWLSGSWDSAKNEEIATRIYWPIIIYFLFCDNIAGLVHCWQRRYWRRGETQLWSYFQSLCQKSPSCVSSRLLSRFIASIFSI